MTFERATDLNSIYSAFGPEPLDASQLPEFYSDALNVCRNNNLYRRMCGDLVRSADRRLFFKGVLYGNRGTGKSTEINRLLDSADVKSRFVPVRIDATSDLNVRSFSIIDFLMVMIPNLIESCEAKCKEIGVAFHEAGTMLRDLRSTLAPFFPVLQDRVQTGNTADAGVELNLMQLAKLSARIGTQRKVDLANETQGLAELGRALDRYVGAIIAHLPNHQFLIVGENFDREQVSREMLANTFIEFSGIFRDLRLHLLFTLPVPFVNAHKASIPFRRENQYPIYDIPVCDALHRTDPSGTQALRSLIARRADLALFDDSALDLLIRASGGDLSRLFSTIQMSADMAYYRHADYPGTEARVLFPDARRIVLEQLGMFRQEMGVDPDDPDDAPWSDKRDRLRAIYEQAPDADVPNPVLYHLLRRRAVLYFNGKGRYGIHPLAAEMLREQLDGRDATFRYKGGGLELPDLGQ